MKLLIWFVFCVFVGGSCAGKLGESCTTPNNKDGIGKLYKSCPELIELDPTPENKKFLKASQIERTPEGKIVVCCPVPTSSCTSQREGELGTCIALTECKQLNAMFKKKPVTPATAKFLKASQCGFLDGKPQVCCTDDDKNNGDIIEISTVKPVITTPTVTTTTTTEKPTSSEEVVELDTHLLPKAPDCGTQAGDRIFGGEEAKVYEFPWLALLQYRKPGNELGFNCGGSVINNRYVLTAAHCLQKIPSTWKLVSVRIGEWDLLSDQDCDPDEEDLCLPPVQDIGIAKEIVHPKYKKENSNTHYDIALLRLKKKVLFGEFIKPICLPLAKHLRNKDYSGERLFAAGWGKTENVTKSTKKLFVSLPFFDHDECVEAFSGHKTLNDHQMCAGGILGEDACNGDSGGPLMSKDLVNGLGPYYLAGIVSYGAAECGAEGFPGVYTKVADYLEWIVANIRA